MSKKGDIYKTGHGSQDAEDPKPVQKAKGFLDGRRSIILFWVRLIVIVIGLGWGTAKAGVSTLLWLRGQDLEKLESRIKVGEEFLKARDCELSREFREELSRTKADILVEIRLTRKEIREEISRWHGNAATATRAEVSASTR